MFISYVDIEFYLLINYPDTFKKYRNKDKYYTKEEKIII